jgi:peptidoglycan/xylan/chitin deacetylase (PgdA/CDA1 family)
MIGRYPYRMLRYISKRLLSVLFPDNFILFRNSEQDKKIILTFDDGPHPDTTLKLLDILKENQIKALFFLSGPRIEKYPEIVKSIKEHGHGIGSHGYYHARISEIGNKEYCSGITKTSGILKQVLNEDIVLYRSPYGEASVPVIKYLIQNNYQYVGWTIDSEDTSAKDTNELLMRLNNTVFRNGDIVLFHDEGRHTIEAMPEIVRSLKDRGFSFTDIVQILLE